MSRAFRCLMAAALACAPAGVVASNSFGTKFLEENKAKYGTSAPRPAACCQTPSLACASAEFKPANGLPAWQRGCRRASERSAVQGAARR